MKFIEKLKNVFFEEVPEDEDEEELPQTFAKKIEVPKKPAPEPKIQQEIKREERPVIVREFGEEKEMVLPKEEVVEEKEENNFPMMFDEEDFLEDKKMEEMDNTFSTPTTYKREDNEERELYHGKKELSYVESVRKPNYSYTKSYYEEKDTKGFRPSPIISPVYGVLDKNYRKEEVVTKKETKISVGRSNFDFDTIRNKAFGNDDEEISDKKTRESRIQEQKEEKKIYDVNNNKPQVSNVTLADADEYFNDLGLAYNVDYSDASRNNSNNNSRSTRYNSKNNKREKEHREYRENKENTDNSDMNDVNGNLFDLIDYMHSKDKED